MKTLLMMKRILVKESKRMQAVAAHLHLQVALRKHLPKSQLKMLRNQVKLNQRSNLRRKLKNKSLEVTVIAAVHRHQRTRKRKKMPAHQLKIKQNVFLRRSPRKREANLQVVRELLPLIKMLKPNQRKKLQLNVSQLPQGKRKSVQNHHPADQAQAHRLPAQAQVVDLLQAQARHLAVKRK